MIDLDANATTAMLPEVLDAMLPWLSGNHANPSGSYRAAKLARAAIDTARGHVAALIGADAGEIAFTGSGTESVNTALHSLDNLAGHGKAAVSAIEHSAVLRHVEKQGRGVHLLPVGVGGRVDPDSLRTACAGLAYLSIMSANNETGVIQPLGELSSIARGLGLPIHTDAIQAIGKIPFDVRTTAVDMLSLSAHKFHGPKGIGALYIRNGLDFSPLLLGGGQENGRRSGTENVAAIVAMGEAARLATLGLGDGISERIRGMRDSFENEILAAVTGVTLNGDPQNRLPNTSHISFEGCDAAGLLILLDEAGVACSAGSACMTGKQKPSHVQLAMGIPEQRAKTSLRFSFSRLNTAEESAAAAAKVIAAVGKLRRVQGNGIGPVAVYSG
ncbi:aminotransferase class V-fold PLP-dependent enzyme [Akkermansiaceae bacterium]|nr:aminotransferase class V-fold PLP-dependent enzyme [Akkermansiaceae bacterium]